MAIVLYWYDFICFGIVGAAFLGSLVVLWRKEDSSQCDDNTVYESLLTARPETDWFVPKAHVGSAQLWTSCWKGVHPGWLLVTRFGSFVAMAGFLSWDIADWGPSIFVYYTEWTFTLVILYFALGTIVSAHGCWVYCYSNENSSENGARDEYSKRNVEESIILAYYEKEVRGKIKLQSHYVEEVIQRRAGSWGYLLQIVYQTGGGAVILTDIVFWCVIVPFLSTAHSGLNTLMCCMHSLNLVFILLETTLNNMPFPWFRAAYFVQWTCVYVVFQWVLHAGGFPWWPYPFMELDTPWAPLWYFIVAAIHIPCYGIYVLIVKAKNSIFSRWFPNSFLRSY